MKISPELLENKGRFPFTENWVKGRHHQKFISKTCHRYPGEGVRKGIGI